MGKETLNCTICLWKQDSRGEFHAGWTCKAVPESDVEGKYLTYTGPPIIQVFVWESIARCATRASVLERLNDRTGTSNPNKG